MNAAIRMTRLDLYCIKPILKSYAISVGVMALLGIVGLDVIFIMMMAMLNLLTMAGVIFSVQEKNHLDRLYGTLSVSNRDVVLGRYVFFALHGLVAIVLSAASYILAGMRGGSAVAWDFFLVVSVVALLTYLLMMAVQLPFFFRFGYAMGRILIMVAVVVIFSAYGAWMYVNDNPEMMLETLQNISQRISPPMLAVMALLIAAIALCISYWISLRVYGSKRK